MQSQNINQLSYLRAIACIAIVFFHTIQFSDTAYASYIPVQTRIISMVSLQLLYWAVPIFILVSGILHLNPQKTLSFRKLFEKYILRIVISLVVFSFIYHLIDLMINKQSITLNSLLSVLKNILTGTGWSHLWYLYMLIGVYLMLPIFKIISANIDVKTIRYFLIIILIFQSIVPLIDIFDLKIAFYIPIYTIYPLYFFLGYAINQNVFRLSKTASIILLTFSSFIIAIIAFARWRYDYTIFNHFFNYGSIFVVFQVISIYNLSTFGKKHINGFKKFLLFIDQQSFGIYMIHLIVIIVFIYLFQFNPYQFWNLVGVILFGIVATIISLLITWILRKVPLLKKIV